MRKGRERVVIENVSPEIDGGHFLVKRGVGERVLVEAGEPEGLHSKDQQNKKRKP